MNHSPSQLTDDALLIEVKRLAQCERETAATLIAHLVEVEVRELFHAEGCSSMFKYCTEILRFSEHATYLRLRAARAVNRHREILTDLASGALNLSVIEILEPCLTSENHAELIAASRHKTKREVEKLIRDREPLADVPATIRKLPASPPLSALVDTATPIAAVPLADRTVEPARRPSVVTPLSPARYKVQFTGSELLLDKLRRAQDLLRHRIPSADVAQVFELALTVLVDQLEKQKLAATNRPRRGRGTASGSRTIPAAVRRAVWERDGGRCALVAKNGRRCTETGFLEFHHVVAFAHGGAATVENIALRCRAHNQYEARLDFGAYGGKPSVVREASATWDVVREVPATWMASRGT